MLDPLEVLSGHNVFITGATGFVGKVILEKLIRSVILPRCDCQAPGNGAPGHTCSAPKIFVLLRPKKPHHPTARGRFFAELATSPIWSVVREMLARRLGLTAPSAVWEQFVTEVATEDTPSPMTSGATRHGDGHYFVHIPDENAFSSTSLEKDTADLPTAETGLAEMAALVDTTFKNLLDRHVVPVAGDTLSSAVVEDPEMRLRVINEVDVFIHCAASIDFDERLDLAVQDNVFGTRNVVDLALDRHYGAGKPLGCFLHMSTAYVNANQPSGLVVSENMPILPPKTMQDPEGTIQHIMDSAKRDLPRLEKNTPKYIGTHPNTYTYTKALSEHAILRHLSRAHDQHVASGGRMPRFPMRIIRPSIVGCAVHEPRPGWIDSVAAVAALVLFSGVGVVRYLRGDDRLIGDVVPVDHVARTCLLIMTECCAATERGEFTLLDSSVLPMQLPECFVPPIVHSGSSDLNPMYWGEVARWVSLYWRMHEVERRVDARPLEFLFYRSHLAYKVRKFIDTDVPSTLFWIYSRLPLLGSQDLQKKADLWKKVASQSAKAGDAFLHFMTNEWIYDATTCSALDRVTVDSYTSHRQNLKVPEFVNEFGLQDQTFYDWEYYWRYFAYGMQKWVLKEEVSEPTELWRTCMIESETSRPWRAEDNGGFLSKMFPDISWAYKNYKTNVGIESLVSLRTSQETAQKVLKKASVREAIEKLKIQHETQAARGKRVSFDAAKHAERLMEDMAGNLTVAVARVFAYFFRKMWRRLYQGIHVDVKGIEVLRAHLDKGPLLLMPSHRSYVDFLLISYIFFEHNMPLPRIAAGEDFLGITFVTWFFRNSGAFFMRRQMQRSQTGIPGIDDSALYQTLFRGYVQQLVRDWSPIEFFLEGTRSRSGKSLHPKFGLLNLCTEPMLKGKVPDLVIAPISITYEKILEADLHSQGLLGVRKPKETFGGAVKGLRAVLAKDFGRINVLFNPPISAQAVLSAVSHQVSEPPVARVEEELLVSVPPTLCLEEPQFGGEHECDPEFDALRISDHRHKYVSALAYQISRSIDHGSALTSTNLVACVLLAYRTGITMDDLIDRVGWLREEINMKGVAVSYEGRNDRLCENGLALLEPQVHNVGGDEPIWIPRGFDYGGSVLSGKGKSHVVANHENVAGHSLLTLSIYRNMLLRVFVAEGLVACVIESSVAKNGLSRKEVAQECEFLYRVMQEEFVEAAPDFLAVIDLQIERGILVEVDAAVGDRADDVASPPKRGLVVAVSTAGLGAVSFMCHLFWPLLDSYYVSALSLLSLLPNVAIKRSLYLRRTQWLADKLLNESTMSYFESAAIDSLHTSLNSFTRLGVTKFVFPEEVGIKTLSSGKKSKDDRLVPPEPLVMLRPRWNREEPLSDFVTRVQKLRQQPKHLRKNLRRVVVHDFPVMSKL